MFQGYYNLTSAMLTQTRNLNVIGTNMSNVSTPGYKSDQMAVSSFEEQLVSMSYEKSMVNSEAVGGYSGLVYADRNYTNYEQGAYVSTGLPLDFALLSEGFYTVQTADGNVYTRNGSFSLDEEGYLALQGVGRVLGTNGAPILLNSTDIKVDNLGHIFDSQTSTLLGRISVVDFEDYENQLVKGDNGTFTAVNGGATEINATIEQGAVEGSNVDSIEEMTKMLSSQRALQSSAQIFSMYDQLIAKIVNNIGR